MDPLVEDNIACLRQGLSLLANITPDVYTAHSEGALNSTIGAHFRHNIDHYECFLEGIDSGKTNYDHRERDQIAESQPATAIERMELLIERLQKLSHTDLAEPLHVKMDSGSDTNEPWSQSTVRRELQFLVSHTVHHYALIAVICRTNGVLPEPDFGVAPSTLRHRANERSRTEAAPVACAQ
ncbi:MAG: DinB family protein [Verrucomicrobiota bacterium]